MADNLDEIEAFVVPIIDEAFDRACLEGAKMACCLLHLTETIQSTLIKHIVRSVFARYNALESRSPTLDEMREESVGFLGLMRAYYDECRRVYEGSRPEGSGSVN